MLIRQATSADLPALQRLYGQLHPADDSDDLSEAFAVLTAFPGAELFVTEDHGVITGSFTLYTLPNLTHGGRPAAILENIVVDETHRGRGIGRAMLEFARELAQERNCYKLSLTSNAKRQDAHAFYLRCGMTQHGVSFRYTV